MYLKKNRKTEKASNLFLQLRNSEKCSLLGCFGGFFVFDNFAYHTQHNAGTFFSTGFRLAVHRETKMNKNTLRCHVELSAPHGVGIRKSEQSD